MNKDVMKTYLIRDKGFLKSIYESQNSRKLLQTAEDSELKTLILFLHFLANGEIHLKKENFDKLNEFKKLSILRKSVEKKTRVLNLLKSSRVVKITFLLKLLKVFPFLLYPLFNEI
jgi:hypothetical protein